MIVNNAFVIRMDGEIELKHAVDFRDRLRSALADHQDIVIDASDLAAIDASIVQLLVAAQKTAAKTGRSIRMIAPADGVLGRFLIETGFVDAHGAPLAGMGDFWRLSSTAAISETA